MSDDILNAAPHLSGGTDPGNEPSGQDRHQGLGVGTIRATKTNFNERGERVGPSQTMDTVLDDFGGYLLVG
jgi:hypothetical protein